MYAYTYIIQEFEISSKHEIYINIKYLPNELFMLPIIF